jgi:hypothetical protein
MQSLVEVGGLGGGEVGPWRALEGFEGDPLGP